MFGVFPLEPAYGRDYHNKSDLEKDFRAGKDFRTSSGKMTSIRDFKSGTYVSFRYASLRKAVSIRV